jgi:tetratricopeptide (TPR) repeat protein
MIPKQRHIICGLLLAAVLVAATAHAGTPIWGERAKVITGLTSHGQFAPAIDSSRLLIAAEPDNPVGYVLLALAYYGINNQYRNDSYADSVSCALDTAIAMAERRADRDKDPTGMYFVLGSAYGCRALYRSIHGGWFGAFKDGVHSCSNLEKVRDRDSALIDALSGIGAYHYWKSAKAKILTVLPFVRDRRKQGISEILMAIKAGGFMAVSARKSLLAIYFNEKRYADVLAVGDTLVADSLLDPNSRLHTARALIKLERWDEANRALDQVLAAWESSPYYDPCGRAEVLYLRAEIYVGQGNAAKARECLKQIFDDEGRCEKNEYFQQSLSSAENLKP